MNQFQQWWTWKLHMSQECEHKKMPIRREIVSSRKYLLNAKFPVPFNALHCVWIILIPSLVGCFIHMRVKISQVFYALRFTLASSRLAFPQLVDSRCAHIYAVTTQSSRSTWFHRNLITPHPPEAQIEIDSSRQANSSQDLWYQMVTESQFNSVENLLDHQS